MNRPKQKTFLSCIWAWACSLKLAILFASLATLLIMGGSLIMHKHPAVFGSVDQKLMRDWLLEAWKQSPYLVWWIPVSGLCLVLFAVNTFCCLIDWMVHIRMRWRKTGEYLIHTGFILLVVAYAWNSVDGFRSGPHRLFPGEELLIEGMPGYTLRLDQFTPKVNDLGQPLDMINFVSLWQGEQEVKRSKISINHPLSYQGLVVLPVSFGRELEGYRFQMADGRMLNLTTGTLFHLRDGVSAIVMRLLPNARQSRSGQVLSAGNHLDNPAMLMAVQFADGRSWRGWYFLRGPLPEKLAEAGFRLQPIAPVFRTYSLLTINRDPGSGLALFSAFCLGFGIFLSFFSFYSKRAKGDYPQI